MPNPLINQAIADLRSRYPSLPDDYFDYLSRVGWGETEAGRMIYEGPVHSHEIYGTRKGLEFILLLGDDFQGHCFGYNEKTKSYGEVSNRGDWTPWPPSKGLSHYVDRH